MAVEVAALHLRRPVRAPLGEPVQLHQLGRELALGHERLDAEEQPIAVGLHDDADAALRRLAEHRGHGHLSARVEVDLRLLHVDDLARQGGLQRNQHGERLRDAEADVGDVHEIAARPLRRPRDAASPAPRPRRSASGAARSAWRGRGRRLRDERELVVLLAAPKPTSAMFTKSPRAPFAGRAMRLTSTSTAEVCVWRGSIRVAIPRGRRVRDEHRQLVVLLAALPVEQDAGRVGLEGAREHRTDGGHRVASLRVAAEAGEVDDGADGGEQVVAAGDHPERELD